MGTTLIGINVTDCFHLTGYHKVINYSSKPLAKWSGSRFQSSGSWIHNPPSGPVCMYW